MKKILLIGCGKMGSALLKGWIKAGFSASDISVIEPQEVAISGVNLAKNVSEISGAFDAVIIAVKPQILDDAMPAYKKLVHEKTVFISIAAGKSLENLEGILGKNSAIIRTMPNLPAEVQQGLTAYIANKNVNENQLEFFRKLFKSNGDILEISDEKMMDAVTAISGSGPAYIFHFIEALTKAGIIQGFDEQVALKLAKSTVFGASLMAYGSDISPEILRKNVTSPNGTTEAALKVLMNNDIFEKLINEAVDSATKRSIELRSKN
jgi:pyrroline-5-carboxylate reductase